MEKISEKRCDWIKKMEKEKLKKPRLLMDKRILEFSHKYGSKIIILSIVIIMGCRHVVSDAKKITYNTNVSYDINIDYNSIPLDDKRSLAGGDSVAIGFYGMFSNDTALVYKNDKFYKTKILTSDSQNEDGGYLMLDKYQLLENVGIRLNGGPLIYIETCKRDYHISLSFHKDIANVKFHKYLPATY